MTTKKVMDKALYRRVLYLEPMMNKKQKPLRGIRDELLDCSWSYEKRKQVEEAYHAFWETLDECMALALDSLLY